MIIMHNKEITILVGYHKGNNLISENCLYYRFFNVKDGVVNKIMINRKRNESTIDYYEELLNNFFVDKKLISVGYDTLKMTKYSEEYLGVKLVNASEEKLNIYFTSNALYAFSEIENLIAQIKSRDFYEYAINPISKNIVERMTIRPSDGDRSSILYVLNNSNTSYLNIAKQLGYYYRKNNHEIDQDDLQIIFSLIRYFINTNIDSNPYYEYTKDFLFIKCNKNAFIEINDVDLIDEIEKSRILDDLWLVMHNLIPKMPLQEESIKEKEELKRIRTRYLESKHLYF